MSRCEKLVAKARKSPKNITFSELRSLAECIGFQFARSKGSHFIYKLPGAQRVISIQEGKNGKAKPYQVKQLLREIDQLDDGTVDDGSY